MEQITVKTPKLGMEKIIEDLISRLPDHILHQIMSLLPQRYAVATSVLSHRWEKLWLSFPSIILNETDFNDRESFYLCLGATLARHKFSGLQNLRLRMKFPGSLELFEHVCIFMNRVLLESRTLKELEVQFSEVPYFLQHELSLETICVLPNEMFSLTANLIFLRVEGCRFEGRPVFNLPSLKTLLMKHVFITEEFLLALIHGCPVIDMLSIKYCFGIKNVRIYQPSLKILVLGFHMHLESLELHVPCVKSFKFYALFNSITEDGLMHVLGYKNSDKILAKNLETFYLKHLSIKPEVLHNIISIFPNLEKLGLRGCDILGRVQLYTNKLATLEMNGCLLREEVDISAPNLQSIIYLHKPEGVELNYMAFMAFMYLRRVVLDGIKVNGILSINHSNWPTLVSLKLVSCIKMEELRVCLDQLESLDVCACEDLKSCMIVAPQLSTFSYTGHMVHISHLVASKNLHVILILAETERSHEHVQMEFVKMFTEFLQKLDVSAARMTIKLAYECAMCWLMIKDVPIPPLSFVQNLEVETMYWMKRQFALFLDFSIGLHLEVGMDEFSIRDVLSCSLGISSYCKVISINYLGLFSLTLQFQEIKNRKTCLQKTNFALLEDLLVKVDVRDFTFMYEEINMIAYLVEKAKNLQQMTIWIGKGDENENAKQTFLQECVRTNGFSRLLQHFEIVGDGRCISCSRNAS